MPAGLKMRRLFVFFALVFIAATALWWGEKEFGRRPNKQNSPSYRPGLYLVDSKTLNRLESLPGLEVGDAVSKDKVLVRVTLPILSRHGPELKPYTVPRIAPELKNAGSKEKLLLNISLFSPADKEKVAKAVLACGGVVVKGTGEEGAVLRIELPAAALAKIAALEAVLRIETYTPPQFLSDRAAAVIGTAPSLVPGFITPQGLSGTGQIVGVADSGLDKGDLDDLHPDFQSVPGKMPKVVLLRSWAGGATADTNGHGTHVAGIIAGTGAASGGCYRGIAPEASIYFQAIVNASGEPDPPADLVALFRPAYSAGVRVHVDGWGGGSNNYSVAAAQIDRFCYYNPDFLPVFGSGNSGPAPKTLTSEANSKNALVVGASENPRPLFGYTNPDTVARLSGRGPAGDGRIKPDLVAPGVGVIAPRSRVFSNLAESSLYVRQDGTSMAAAVAGGAALLLREYLRQEDGVTAPPAALLKGLLINGARSLGQTANNGFGLLDFAGTVLALKEHTFSYTVQEPGLAEGERAVSEVVVRDSGTPLKVTLCWTDPQALAGAAPALINDLDLIVEGPDGRRYLGNDFERRELPDRLNNVEQVNIFQPMPGRYRIIVTGFKVSRGQATPDGRIRQAYSLVYGQPVGRDVVEEASSSGIKLKSGRVLQWSGTVTAVLNGKLAAPEQAFGPGTDVYLPAGTEKVYAVGEKQRLAPARFIKAEAGTVAARETEGLQDGGYLLRSETIRAQGRNSPPTAVPAGVSTIISINPSTQTVWQVDAGWTEREGFLEAFRSDSITLIGGVSYPLEPGYAVAREADPVGLDALDQVFGPPSMLEAIPSGIPVKLRLDPQTHSVLHIAVYQKVISGFVKKVAGDLLVLADGRRYQLFPGAHIFRGPAEEKPEQIAPGEHITGTILGETGELLQVRVDTGLLYGQMLYAGAGGKTLYLQDNTGNYRLLEMAPGACYFRGAVSLGQTVLGSGQWVRLALDQKGRVTRVDMGGETNQASGTVQDCDAQRGLIRIGEATYRVSPGSMITKNSYPVDLEYIRPGESVAVTFWKEGEGVPVALAIRSRNTTQPPFLEVFPPVFGKPLSGRTGGTHLYLYPDNGRISVNVSAGGGFSCPIDWAHPGAVRLVAVDARTGGVNGVWIELPRGPRVFNDINGHWAAKEIEALAAEGLLAGYPDGSFRPDKPFTRVEFAALLARFGQRTSSASGTAPADAPAWAREAVKSAVYQGFLTLFPGGSFRPNLPVNRVTVAMALDSLKGDGRPAGTPPYRDWAEVPDRAREAVARLYESGIMRGRSNGLFAPLAPVTRAEAAVIFYRLRVEDAR